jgi:hypothetical protein
MMVVRASSLSRCEMHMLGSNIVGAVQRDRDARASVNRPSQFRETGPVLSVPSRIRPDDGSAMPALIAC